MNLAEKKVQLTIKMRMCTHILKELLQEIKYIENNNKTPINDRILQMKKIREELSKVGAEIDNIKKEIKLTQTYSLN